MMMNEREQYRIMRRMLIIAMQGIVGFFAVLLLFAVLSTCIGCKQIEYVPVIEHKTDSIYIQHVKHDSIHVHDSIWAEKRGDTIFIDRWHNKYIEKLMHDTTYIATHDTIPQPYEVQVIVKERYIPKFVGVLAWIGGIIILGLIVYIFIVFLKRS